MRFWAFWTLGILAVACVACLGAALPGLSDHLNQLLIIIAAAESVAVPVFLVTTGLIRLPGSFWSFATRQLAGFATATFVLLVLLGAYSRKGTLLTPDYTIWQLAKSLGPLLAQGVRCLVSGATLGAGTGAAGVLVYVLGWIVFVMVAGVEVSLIADRASEELAKVEARDKLCRPPSE